MILTSYNIAILDSVRVRIDGSTFQLRDLAQVTIRDPQTLLVIVHDSEVCSFNEKMGKLVDSIRSIVSFDRLWIKAFATLGLILIPSLTTR